MPGHDPDSSAGKPTPPRRPKVGKNAELWSVASLGIELAGAIVGMLLLGYVLDRVFDTDPVLTIIGLFVGLLAGGYSFMKQAIRVANTQSTTRRRSSVRGGAAAGTGPTSAASHRLGGSASTGTAGTAGTAGEFSPGLDPSSSASSSPRPGRPTSLLFDRRSATDAELADDTDIAFPPDFEDPLPGRADADGERKLGDTA